MGCSLFWVQQALAANDGMGNVIQLRTNLHSFVGKPTWLIVIRDLDHNENIPYLYDLSSGDSNWLALTYGQHYLIATSTLQFNVYRPQSNTYRTYRIQNFCGIESHGRINRNTGMSVLVQGDLAPFDHQYRCHVANYVNDNFSIASPSDNDQ